MIIESCSCLGSFGHDAAALAGAFSGEKNDAFFEKTDTNALKEFHPARVLRQCDHFSRLALLAASRAMAASGITDRAGIGIILASGYGPTLATYDFLDSLLDYGEAMASPLAFSLTVHNIPAAVVAKTMQIVGPCATVCQFESSVASALLLARNWLDEGRVAKVLFGAVDEMTPVLRGIVARMATEREARGAPAIRRNTPPGEAAAFFLLSRDGRPGAGVIEEINLACGPYDKKTALQADIRFMSGTFPAETRAAHGALDGSSAYGNLPVAQALDCILALDMLKRRRLKTACCLNAGAGMHSAVVLSGADA